MTEFTPGASFLGGLTIGLAAGLLLLLNGKIAGISGIIGGLFGKFFGEDKLWRYLFLLGLIIGGFICINLIPQQTAKDIHFDTAWVIAAGLFVGVGTSLGSGCTSGHGICGLARFSKRSIVATLTFMGSGFLTTYILKILGVSI
ncbi:MAG: YeeE/YedE family protein [Bacteriovoracaceae bacterium]|nr:YeeE/YedE family protein [Bacteriovoracaceae bacterium]